MIFDPTAPHSRGRHYTTAVGSDGTVRLYRGRRYTLCPEHYVCPSTRCVERVSFARSLQASKSRVLSNLYFVECTMPCLHTHGRHRRGQTIQVTCVQNTVSRPRDVERFVHVHAVMHSGLPGSGQHRTRQYLLSIPGIDGDSCSSFVICQNNSDLVRSILCTSVGFKCGARTASVPVNCGQASARASQAAPARADGSRLSHRRMEIRMRGLSRPAWARIQPEDRRLLACEEMSRVRTGTKWSRPRGVVRAQGSGSVGGNRAPGLGDRFSVSARTATARCRTGSARWAATRPHAGC